MHRTKPTLLQANQEGYTVLALSQCRQEMPADTWRLSLVSEQPVQGWNPISSSRQELYEGDLSQEPWFGVTCLLVLIMHIAAVSQD